MKIFIQLFIIILNLEINHIGNTSNIEWCNDKQPFRLNDQTCGNYTEICKKGGDQCNELRNACKHCPASVTNSDLENIKKISEKNNILLIIVIVIVVVFIILLLVEIRFKLITKLCQRKSHTYDRNYQLVRSRKMKLLKFNNNNPLINEIINSIKIVEEKINSKFLRIDQQIKFEIEGENKPIMLNISSTDNVVRVKRQICNKWSKSEPNYYKIMKLKYKESILDDNDYLLSIMSCNDDVIYCTIDYSIVADDIVVVHIDGIAKCDTELIQVNKNDTIDHVKNIIHKLYNCTNISIYQTSGNSVKFTKLDDCATVGKYQLKDNDVIKIVEKKNGRVSILSIFDGKHLGDFDFTNTDLLSIIYEDIRKRERSEDFVLSLYNQYLDREYFIFQYNIDHETEINYLQFHKLDCLKEKNNSDHFKAKDIFIDREIFVKKYKFPKENDISNLLRELNTFTTIRSHPRFVQLYGAYKDGNDYYISMEYFARGSLRNILCYQRDRRNIPSKDIIKWSKQILEGINYLNNHGIIHGNLTTSSILFDENNEIKLSSFGMSKYITGARIFHVMYIIPATALSNAYRAPEIINRKPSGIKVDVWSFGIILGEIITGLTDHNKIMEKLNKDFTETNFEENPTQKCEEISKDNTGEDNKDNLLHNSKENITECSNQNPEEISKRMSVKQTERKPEINSTNDFININKRTVSKQFKEIIGKCLIEDPIKRISVKELINNYFIKLN